MKNNLQDINGTFTFKVKGHDGDDDDADDRQGSFWSLCKYCYRVFHLKSFKIVTPFNMFEALPLKCSKYGLF